MSGVPFRVDGKGRVLVSWMSRDKVYWSMSTDGGKRFMPRVQAPDASDQGNPMALMNGKGEALLLWTEGRQVNWAIYTEDGRRTGQKGSAGQLPGNHKPTAFVGPDNAFHVIF